MAHSDMLWFMDKPSSKNEQRWTMGIMVTAVLSLFALIAISIQRAINRLMSMPPPTQPTQHTTVITPAVRARPELPRAEDVVSDIIDDDIHYLIESPPWERSTKFIVTIVFLVIVVWLAFRFQTLIALLVIGAMIAYLLNPIIVFLDNRTEREDRNLIILVVYLLIALTAIAAFIFLGIAAFEQAGRLLEEAPTFIRGATEQIGAFVVRTEPLVIGPITIQPSTLPWDQIQTQVSETVTGLADDVGNVLQRIIAGTFNVIANIGFAFVISIYIAMDIPRYGNYIGDLAQTPGYRADAERLTREFGRVWSSYLRGQLILGFVIWIVVWLALSIAGVQNALALGLLSGLLEFIPLIGPLVGAGAAVIVALFQSPADAYMLSEYFQLVGWQLAALVAVIMIVVQQLENNLLVPKIVGDSLDLHPLIVMISVFMGGSLAGILGAILAAPVAASLKLIGIYVWRKMFDDEPFEAPEPLPEPTSTSLREQAQLFLWRTAERLNTRRKTKEIEDA